MHQRGELRRKFVASGYSIVRYHVENGNVFLLHEFKWRDDLFRLSVRVLVCVNVDGSQCVGIICLQMLTNFEPVIKFLLYMKL
jgi:hypothetical protein